MDELRIYIGADQFVEFTSDPAYSMLEIDVFNDGEWVASGILDDDEVNELIAFLQESV